MNIKIYSKALYSSWGLHYPTRTLFDCGEGSTDRLMSNIFAIERVCIGHASHTDHSGGLPSLIGARATIRGDNSKPLSVYMPESKRGTALRRFIMESNPTLPYQLIFEDVYPGYRIELDKNRWIETFDVKHTYNSIGYKVMERRTRLKPGVNPADIKALKASGIEINETYEAATFVWLLDSVSFDLTHIQNAQTVCFDATFLKAADREDPTHATVEECLTWAKETGVKRALLCHISTRYSHDEILTTVPQLVQSVGYQGVVETVLGGRVYEFN